MIPKNSRTPNHNRPAGARNHFARAEKKRRQEEAAVRQAARAARTSAQQLARLDEKLGRGLGAARERARLAAPAGQSPAGRGDTTQNKKT